MELSPGSREQVTSFLLEVAQKKLDNQRGVVEQLDQQSSVLPNFSLVSVVELLGFLLLVAAEHSRHQNAARQGVFSDLFGSFEQHRFHLSVLMSHFQWTIFRGAGQKRCGFLNRSAILTLYVFLRRIAGPHQRRGEGTSLELNRLQLPPQNRKPPRRAAFC
jgi:hypothetical protein